MKKIKELLQWFVYITPCVLLVTATVLTLRGQQQASTLTLWQVLFSSFVTALVTVVLRPSREVSLAKFILWSIPHYLCICVVMFLLGSWFGWIDFTWLGAVFMCIYVAIAYVGIVAVNYLISKREADKMNEKLKEKYEK